VETSGAWTGEKGEVKMRSFVMAVTGVALAASSASAELVYGVTLNQTLVRWDSAAPGTILGGVAISGLASNENLRGIDFRPATGELFGVGSFNQLYTINAATGAATPVGPALSPGLNGSSFGFDFNPTVDRLRIVSDADQNLRINPISAAVIVDGTLAYAAGDANFGVNPNIVGAAYTNNFAGATSTQLFVIDTGLDVLALQSPANSGVLTTIGPIGTDLSDVVGFDISGATGIAYTAVRDNTLARTTFWTINLSTGQGMMVGEVGGGSVITAIAVVPAPGAAALLAGLPLLARRRRR
jgi:hypothetical protein